MREDFQCARNVLHDVHADPEVLEAASAFLGGTVFRGLTCSALTASVMALGLRTLHRKRGHQPLPIDRGEGRAEG